MLRRNILIFHSGALGDFVLSWPLALGLSRLNPQSRIVYVTQSQKGRLAERSLGVEWTDGDAGWHVLYSANGRPEGRALHLLLGAREVYSFAGGAEQTWADNVRRVAPEVELMLLGAVPPADYARHATAHLLEQLDARLTVHEATRQMLHAIAQRGLGHYAAVDGPVLIHPGSGGQGKCWPLDRFVDLAAKLTDEGLPVRFILGEAEIERWDRERIESLTRVAEVRTPGSYLELHHELMSGRALVANDSGPGHLAAVCGVPTLSLFGPTNPDVWRPLGPRTAVRRRQPLDTLSVDEVRTSLMTVLPRLRAVVG